VTISEYKRFDEEESEFGGFPQPYPEWVGRTFLVTEVRELLVTLDGSEQVEEGDSIEDIVARQASSFPLNTWELVDQEIVGAST
jgi:hypothetical protein